MNGQIFISYRREESRWSARSLRDRLCRDFDPKQIFIDIDAIALGEDFVEVIETTVAKCDVLIALIGNNWLTSKDDHGNRRLDNPKDFVRMEIGAALKRKIRVIPVLVDGASMPQATELPEDLKPLVRRNALLITDTSFDGDCQRLASTISLVLEKATAEQERSVATSTPRAQTEADKVPAETPKVIHPPPPKDSKPEDVKPTPPSSGGTGDKSSSKQRIAFFVIAAILVVAGLIYVATRAFHSPPPKPASVVAVTPSPPVIATPSVEGKVPPTPEVTVQPTAQPTAPVAVAIPSPPISATPTAQPNTPTPPQPARPVQRRGIDNFFGALPPQDFTKSAPSDLLKIISSGGENILDRKNGYMFLKGDRDQASLQIALYLDAAGRPFLAIAWGNPGGPDFTHLSFFTEKDGMMVPANRRTILLVLDSDKLRFELPRYGLTLVVRESSGKVHSKWNWNRDRAKFEKVLLPGN